MRNSLLIVQFKQLFSSLLFKKKTKSTLAFIIFLTFFAGIICFSMGASYYVFAESFAAVNMAEFVFFQAGLSGVMLIILLTTIESQTHLFKSKDFELLQSLPIKSSTIVFAKIGAILLSSYIYTLVFFAPAVVVYFLFIPFNIISLLLCLFGVVLFPLLPTAIGLALGLLIAYISSFTKKSNLLNFILTFIFCIGYMLLSTKTQDFINLLISKGHSILNSILYVLPSAGLFITGIIKLNILHITLYVLLNILFILCIGFLISLPYRSINLKLQKTHFKIAKGDLKFNQAPITKALLKIEAKRYFNTPVYLFNTFFVGLMAIIIPIMLKFSGLNGLDTMSLSGEFLIIVITCISSTMLASCNTSCSSISIEGTKFYTLKSLPINTTKIFRVKILFNILISGALCLIADIITILLFMKDLTLLSTIGLIVLPPLAIIASSIFGLLINLFFPKIHFDNYAQIVKQSASATIALFGCMSISAIPLIVFLATNKLPLHLFLLFSAVCYIVWGGISYILIKIKGQKLYNSID